MMAFTQRTLTLGQRPSYYLILSGQCFPSKSHFIDVKRVRKRTQESAG